MPGQFVLTIDSDRFQRRLHEMERNMLDLAPAARAIFATMGLEERALFASLHGRYVRTGRTRDSLTQTSGEDAIREAHANEFVFGSAVEYAVYLKNPPILRISALNAYGVGRAMLDHVFS